MCRAENGDDMNRKLPKRKSLRLKHYDYSQQGYYFITLCTYEKMNLFGSVKNDVIIINDAGYIVETWYKQLESKFDKVRIDSHVVMPNHFHCILAIVGDDRCVVPKEAGAHMGAPLQKIIQWFKTMTTNEYIKGVKSGEYRPFNKHIWQRGYYEHIIRSEQELQEIREYIVNNPIKWVEDEYYI